MALKLMAAMLVALTSLVACGSDTVVSDESDATNVVASSANPPSCEMGLKNQDCIDWITSVEGQCHRQVSCVRHTDSTGSPVDVCVIGAAAPQGQSCDDGSMCTTGDTCVSGKCGGKVVDCDDKNTCTNDSCDAKTGCQHSVQSGVLCSDGDACTNGDKCDAGGKCTGEKPECDDKNLCTTDSCDKAKGCVSVPNANPCDDGNVCTEGDLCAAGACAAGKSKVCDDGSVCTDDSCDAAIGCKFVAKADALKAPCSDKDPTTSEDTCVGGKCVGKAFWQCDVDEDCLATIQTKCGTPICLPLNEANPAEKACKVLFTLNVSDGNDCTEDFCDIKQGPQHIAKVGLACDDGDVCTTFDSCTAEKTCKGSAKQCDDGDACTFDSCDKNTGNCVHKLNTCDDGNAFTEDSCSFGTCKSVAGVIMANAQMPETYTAKEVADNNLSTKLNSWLENAVGEQSMMQPIKGMQTLDAKSTCEAMYLGPKLCFNTWLTIGVTAENINMGGSPVLIKDSTMKNGAVVKPKDAGIGYYDLPDACIGWEEIPICLMAKGK
jgi:hypothetical protein